MSQLSKAEANSVLQKVLSFAKADETQVNLSGGREGNLRFARNAVSTSGGTDTMSLVVQSSFGKKTGTATINEFDNASLEKVVRRAESLARVAPDNEEYVEFLGPQKYPDPKAYFESTAAINAEFRARATAESLKPVKAKNLSAAGYLEHDAGFSAIANSKGLFGYQRSSHVNFSVTARSADGLGSGYGVCDFNDATLLNTKAVSETAVQKAIRSAETRAIEPGKYTVILEPAAGVELLTLMVSSMDARQADEGRSFLSKPGGASKVGEKLVDERVHIFMDPMNADVPIDAWVPDGRASRRVDWIKEGVVANLGYSRFWARKQGLADDKAPPGFGGGFGKRGIAQFEGETGLAMTGGKASLDELVKGVKHGVLITRLWYIREVDPQTLLQTGLTRDGTFYIENGEIKYAIKNMRFNESPVIMLNNIEALGKPERANGSMIPPMVLRDFTFTSLSDAV
ncbi:peptidase C69 [Verrucomicrobia bacterium SCGC AG-212-E04]|nr:peptidase C69 [Verrucomicrobia bacterium SCGC AG-212-E04]